MVNFLHNFIEEHSYFVPFGHQNKAKGKTNIMCHFLSDPGVPGVRSMGPVV